ncbi:Gfo/Idh/MocA family protein [Planctomycetes bacterium TBK1r]|uniref:4,5-dihydroxyphthalate dehydrogenase n=1 Tax=Stieleria magnilauensis TaxID=2527963 RepID=A0ABX5XPC4_9BACT|nr:Putative 4,5-dihydroxyphthalate dehydrogenase [Planctomycetes bacterium TBK1r]
MTDQPRILIIGVGSIGERHLRCFQSTGRCHVGFCEPLSDRRNEVAERYAVNGYESWEQALADERFSAAVIASPAPWHIPTAQALTDRGVHLLIEKPLSLNTDGVSQLSDSIKHHGTRVSIGFVYRSLPALQQMRAVIRSGKLGRIVQVQVQSGQHFPFYRPAYRKIYYADAAQGGGLIQDMLPHFLNAVEWIAGPATKVVVDAAHQVLPGVEVEDTVNVLSRHGDVLASLTTNQHQPVNESVMTVLCQRGAARWELNGHRWFLADEIGGDWTLQQAFDHQRDDFYILQANAFMDLLEGKAEPLCCFDEGVATLRSTLAILKSRQTDAWETVS